MNNMYRKPAAYATKLMCAAMLLFATTACTDFDNYEEPKETVSGVVIDKNTQKPLETEVGEGGLRIKMMEYSWSDSPTPYYFGGMQDGTFNNTRIFKGNYGITVFGAFVPMEEQRHDVKGTLNLSYEVEPFLNIDWAGEPVVNGDGTITARFNINRGTSNAQCQQELSDVRLFIVHGAPYVGENNKDDRFSVYLSGDEAKAMLGQSASITSRGQLVSGRPYHVRIGARIDKEVEGSRRYNYSSIKTIQIP
ncbi:DUF3823 domain-containing protein [Parabacteroides sp. OttesenSCG-928-N08]|nr:DUF3823 domain-containing protein [Parabacteroides sp. OttesenSCG-928-N08]